MRNQCAGSCAETNAVRGRERPPQAYSFNGLSVTPGPFTKVKRVPIFGAFQRAVT
jgi:hypothetical protein